MGLVRDGLLEGLTYGQAIRLIRMIDPMLKVISVPTLIQRTYLADLQAGVLVLEMAGDRVVGAAFRRTA